MGFVQHNACLKATQDMKPTAAQHRPGHTHVNYPVKFIIDIQDWTQHSRCGLSIAEQSKGVTSFSLLAFLLLIQLTMLLVFSTRMHCWLMFCLLYVRTCKSLSASFFPVGHTAVCSGALRYSSSQDAGFCISLLNFSRFLLATILQPAGV